MNTRRRWTPATIARSVGILVAVVALSTIAKQLWDAWPQLVTLDIRPLPTLIALVCGSLSLVITALLWHTMLKQFGVSLSRAKASYIWFLSQVVRYAPGNVWHLLGRVYMSQQAKLDTRAVSVSMVIELLHVITGALLVGAVSLLFWPQQNVFSLWPLLLVPLLMCYLWPSLLQKPLAWALNRKQQHPPTTMLRRRDLFALLPGYCLHWIVYGVGLTVLTYTVYPISPGAFPALTGMYAIAWVVGFLSFITPSGLGVREGVLGYLLGFLMPMPVALLLALLARVWVTLAELLCVAWVIVRRRWAPDSMENWLL